MLAKQEKRRYLGAERVWIGKYKNSHNVLHWHYACELLFVEYGEIDVFCQNKTYTLKKGDAFFIDSGEMHYMHAKVETVLIVAMFENDIIKCVTENYKLVEPKLSNSYNVNDVYIKIVDELAQKKPYYNAVIESEILNLIIKIYRNENLEKRKSGGDTAQSFKDLLADINERFAYYTFEDACNFMRFSDAYFSKFFKKIAGMTFSQYLNRVKIEKSIEMLRKDANVSITEVAIACGFNTIRNFNRIFKELTGYTPKMLPSDFSLDEKFKYAVTGEFNPTSNETTLLTEH